MTASNKERREAKALDDRELEVEMANLRAWNYWGRKWSLHNKKIPLESRTSCLMKTRAATYQRAYQKMVLSIQGLGGKSVLDIGCGTSDYQKWLASDCKRLVGVDISVEMLKLCREDRGKSIELVAADALHLPFKSECFDASTTFQALHHFPNYKKALTEMIRTSKQIVLYEPNRESILHRLLHFIRQTFHVEQRFKQISEDYGLVEFNASGFSSREITFFLQKRGLSTTLFMFGLVPVALLAKVSTLSPRFMFLLLGIEDLVGRLPVLRNQLGGMLVAGSKK